MKKSSPERFSLPKALIVEGAEDKDFILNFLRHLKINDQIYVHEIGGNGGLVSDDERSLSLATRSPEFRKNVRHLAILFDGDGKKEEVAKKVRNKIEEINAGSKEFGLLLAPKQNKIVQDLKFKNNVVFEIKAFLFLFEKNLEDAFLKTLSKKDLDVVEKCVPNFFKCANAETADKRIVQAFLSAKKTNFDLARDIGAAAGQGIVDFNHESLVDLKKFLLDFSKLN